MQWINIQVANNWLVCENLGCYFVILFIWGFLWNENVICVNVFCLVYFYYVDRDVYINANSVSNQDFYIFFFFLKSAFIDITRSQN